MSSAERKPRRVRTGVVVSDKMDKTVVVLLERVVRHPKYKKLLRRQTRVKAHDEKNQCRTGDSVVIAESRPLSRDKRWSVCQVLEKAQ